MKDTMDSDASNIPSETNQGAASATIAAPDLVDGQLKLEAKSVRNAYQAHNICKGLEANNRQRALRTADMQALCDGKPPRGGGENIEKGKDWTANFSSLWLAGIVGRVSQRFVNAVISQPFVTASSLPDNYPNAKTLSDLFRAKFTALVRGWDGNTGFINSIAMETTLQGYCYALFLDPHTWQPAFFKQDELFCPEKSGQHARDLQFFAARRDFRLDKFIDLFKNESAAEANGYDVPACLNAASKAVMQDPRDDAATTIFRKFEDMITEGAIGLAVTGSGERIVKTWLLFNREYDGKVSFWMLERDTGKQLRFSFKLFPRMQDVMAMFSFEEGNGCIHSSKGLGRKLAALATIKELFRCGIVDSARMASLLIVNVDSADKTKFAPVMMSPFILVDKSVDIRNAQRFEFSGEGMRVIDTLIDAWAEQAVGAYLASQISEQGRTERTATEATIDARREDESTNIMIRRCLDQDANRIQMQQLRACAPENVKRARRIYEKITKDPDAKPDELFPKDHDDNMLMRFCVEMMEAGATDEAFKLWSQSPASKFAHIIEAAVQRGITAVKAKYTGNPDVDQSALTYSDLEGMVGADMAQKLFIPKANETLAIEGARAQMMESFTMAGTGKPIGVSPRDPHLIHGAVVVEVLTKTAAPMLSEPNTPDAVLKAAELNLNHLGEHLQIAATQGLNKQPAFKEMEKFYTGFKKQLAEVVQIRQTAKVAQAAVQQQVRTEDAAAVAPVVTSGSGQTPAVPGDFSETPSDEVPSLAAV